MGSILRTAMRWVLAALLAYIGVMHFVALDEFMKLIPPWLPVPEWLVWLSGFAEIAFGVALVVPMQDRAPVGYALAAFLLVVWTGNIYQAIAQVDTFGLDTDAARIIRLPFQPIIILWGLWVTQAWPFGRGRHVSGPE